MKTIEERANTIAERYVDKLHQDIARISAIVCATEQEVIDEDAMHAIIEENVLRAIEKQRAIDEANPSDKMIMRILNAIGYEEESWVQFVREHLREE